MFRVVGILTSVRLSVQKLLTSPLSVSNTPLTVDPVYASYRFLTVKEFADWITEHAIEDVKLQAPAILGEGPSLLPVVGVLAAVLHISELFSPRCLIPVYHAENAICSHVLSHHTCVVLITAGRLCLRCIYERCCIYADHAENAICSHIWSSRTCIY